MNALDSSADANPKLYWRLLEELKKNDEFDDTTNPITTETWVEHYSKLSHRIVNADEEVCNYNLKASEEEEERNDLGCPITSYGVNQAINHLNCGKSAGPDGILAEILKACTPTVTPILTKLFNEILTQGSTQRRGVQA